VENPNVAKCRNGLATKTPVEDQPLTGNVADVADVAEEQIRALPLRLSPAGIKEIVRPVVLDERPNPEPVGGAEKRSMVVAPAQWHASADTPSADRRGLTRREGGRFDHYCLVCGAWGAFGYGVTARNPGQWYCQTHRPKDPQRDAAPGVADPPQLIR
jgi:hypothetical protein